MAEQLFLAIIAVIAFVLAFFAIRTLQAATKTMRQMEKTILKLEGQMLELGSESTQFMYSARDCAQLAKDHLESMRTLFRAVGLLGETLGQLARSLKSAADKFSPTLADESSEAVTSAMTSRLEFASGLLELAALSMSALNRGKAAARDMKPHDEEPSQK